MLPHVLTHFYTSTRAHTHTNTHTLPTRAQRSCLILETGVNQRWRYGGWRTNQDAIEEAENWEDCKQGVK